MTIAITQCANEMWSHWNNTNMSFQQRITESNDAHNKLQSHLSKTMQEIYDQEKHIEALKKAIRDKGAPLKVSQTRNQLISLPTPRSLKHGWRLEHIGLMLNSVEILHTTDLWKRSLPEYYPSVSRDNLNVLGVEPVSFLGWPASREH